MGRVLSGTARTIYASVLSVSFVLDAIFFFLLLLGAIRTGNFGGFVAYVIFGTWLVPTIGHWCGILAASPFFIGDGMNRKHRDMHSSNKARSHELRETTTPSGDGAELLALGSITGILEFQVWDGIFYLRTDVINPTIRFQQREVHDEHGLLGMQKPAWSIEAGGPSINQSIPIDSVEWVRIDSRATDALQGLLGAHEEILSLSSDPNVLTGRATVNGDLRLFVFVGNLGTPFTPVESWGYAFRNLGVKIIEH